MNSHASPRRLAGICTVLLVCLAAYVVGGCAGPGVEPTVASEPKPAPTTVATEEPQPTQDPTKAPPTELPPTPATTGAPTTATPLPPTVAPTEPPLASAEYELVFEATWSADTHPMDFPPNPHFSPLIGASHGPEAMLWQVGELSSPGMKNMAETGGTSPIDTEIDALITAGTACATISSGGVPVSPGSVKVAFTVNLDCPLVSVVTMAAPSPDWFTGVSGLSLLEDGAWVESKVVELSPYDAGTDSGPSYTSPNDPTASREAVYQIESGPLTVDGSVPPLGTFTFTRLDG